MRPLCSVLTAVLVLLGSTLVGPTPPSPARAFAAGIATFDSPAAPAIYRQTNLVSDLPGVALVQDPLLVDPRGVALSATSPFWVADTATERATLYRGDVGGGPLVINSELSSVFIERGSNTGPPSTPTGVVANTTDDFVVSGADLTGPARFIFATFGGDLNGWNPLFGSAAFVAKSMPGRTYTGLAIGSNSGGNRLYAADFAGGRIDVFDGGFNLTTVPGGFATDAFVPAGFHPFNVQNLGGSLYVTYAQFNRFSGLPDDGLGFGYVRKFDTNGVRDASFAINAGQLAAPWGLALAPPDFGPFSGALLVGNFGWRVANTNSIHAYNPATGAFIGTMADEGGAPIKIRFLWALTFGNGAAAGDPNTLYFTSGLSGGESGRHGLLGSLKPAQPAPTIQFAIPIPGAFGFFVSEGAGHADITVTRTGDASGTATVNYATYDGSASQKKDYQIALGTLTFNPGETQKTFRILIVNDNALAGGSSVTLNLVLSNPTGAGLGAPREAELSILDDEGDTPRQPPNTADDTQSFVRQHYFDFLNREPDPPGLNFWVNSIESCGADAQCREVKRIHVSAAFFLSIEFQRTGMIAYLAELAALKRQPPYGQFMRGTQMLQRDLVFGQPGFDAQLEANKQEYFADFVRRPEFVAMYPATLTPAEFVNVLAGEVLTQDERQAAAAEFGGAPTSADLAARARVLRRVAETPSFARAEFNAAFVLMQYFGYLRRDPDAEGYNFWLSKLNSFGGDFVRAEMVKAFITSTEYRVRFGPN